MRPECLLIEPVWNHGKRDRTHERITVQSGVLLIEPVLESKPLHSGRLSPRWRYYRLLIEPCSYGHVETLGLKTGINHIARCNTCTILESCNQSWNQITHTVPLVMSLWCPLLIRQPVWNHGKSLNHINPGSDLSF